MERGTGPFRPAASGRRRKTAEKGNTMLAFAASSTLGAAPSLQSQSDLTALEPQLQSLSESFARRAPEQAATHNQCVARCKDRYDSYLVVNGTHPAGLDDRLFIIRRAHELATSLCARLVLATPHDMLTQYHNHGKEVQRVWWWDRYFDLPLEPPILSLDQFDQQAVALVEIGPTLGRVRADQALPADFDEQLALDYAAASAASLPYVWTLTLCYLDWYQRAATLVPELCKDQETYAASSLVRLAAAGAKQAMGLTDQSLFTLHVRRTDVEKGRVAEATNCNTTVSRVVDYMRCAADRAQEDERSTDATHGYSCHAGQGESGTSFLATEAESVTECSQSCEEDNRCVAFDVAFPSSFVAGDADNCRLYGPNTPSLGETSPSYFAGNLYCSKPKLVLFTDETDETYISELTAELAKLPQWRAGVVHGDSVIESLLDASDREWPDLKHTARPPRFQLVPTPHARRSYAAVARRVLCSPARVLRWQAWTTRSPTRWRVS